MKVAKFVTFSGRCPASPVSESGKQALVGNSIHRQEVWKKGLQLRFNFVNWVLAPTENGKRFQRMPNPTDPRQGTAYNFRDVGVRSCRFLPTNLKATTSYNPALVVLHS